PRYDVAARYQVDVSAAPAIVYEKLTKVNLGESHLVRLLIRLRGIPQECLTLPGLEKMHFVQLGEIKNVELLYGLIGQFWTLSGDLQKVTAEGFRNFDRAEYAKAVWNFSLAEQPGGTKLTTETRVFCLAAESRRRFLWYWRLVGPFSGLI